MLGSWTYEEDEPGVDENIHPAIFTITAGEQGYEVSAIYPQDGEVAEITNLEWDGERLSFHSLFPSTNFPTKKAFTLLPGGEASVENTLWDIWTKFPRSCLTKTPDNPIRIALIIAPDAAPFDEEFVGDWLTAEGVSPASISISRSDNVKGEKDKGNNRYEVSAFNNWTGEAFQIRDLRWDGTTLSFEKHGVTGHFLAKIALTLSTDGTADLELTQRDVWFKLERDFHPSRFLNG